MLSNHLIISYLCSELFSSNSRYLDSLLNIVKRSSLVIENPKYSGIATGPQRLLPIAVSDATRSYTPMVLQYNQT